MTMVRSLITCRSPAALVAIRMIRIGGENHPTVSKSLVKADRQAARQNLHRERCVARGRPIADGGSQYPSGNDVGLPMLLALQSREGVVGGQQFQRPYPRILARIICNERRDETGLQRHLAARKAVAAAPFEPLIRTVAMVGPHAALSDLLRLGSD